MFRIDWHDRCKLHQVTNGILVRLGKRAWPEIAQLQAMGDDMIGKRLDQRIGYSLSGLVFLMAFLASCPAISRAQDAPVANRVGQDTAYDSESPDFWNHESKGGLELNAEKFTPQSLPPRLPHDLRGLPNYRFIVKGSTQDQKFHLWNKPLGKEPQMLGTESEYYAVNELGRLVMLLGDSKADEADVTFGLGDNFARGERAEYCLISRDGKVKAFESITPFPLEATNDKTGYRITLNFLNPYYYTLVAEGFEDTPEVKFFATNGNFFDASDNRYDAQSGMGMNTHAENNRRVFLFAGWEAPKRSFGGSSQITVKGKNGKVILDVDWGTYVKPPRSQAIELFHVASRAYRAQEFDNALKSLNEAVDVDPTYLRAYILRVVINTDQKHNYSQAIADLDRVISIDPTFPSAFYLRGIIRSINPAEAFRDGQKAIVDLTRACELSDWKDATYVANLGAAYAEAGDFKQAIKYHNKATKIGKDDPEFKKLVQGRLALYRLGKPFHLPRN